MRSHDNIRIIHTRPIEVDLKNEDFYIPTFERLDTLLVSIREVGILNAPVLRENSDGILIPLLGRRRIEAAAKLDLPSIEVRVFSSGLCDENAFLMAFWDNLDRIKRDAGVKSYVIRRLLELIPREILAEKVLPALDVPRKGPKLERLRKIGWLKWEILEALSSGRIQEKAALSLAELPIDQREVLFRLIGDLGLNANKASEIVSHLYDLSIYWKESVRCLLARPEALQILNNEQLDLTEKASAFRELVRRWKFPFITQCRQTFDEWVKQEVSPTDKVSLRPAQSFEDESVTIEIRADSRAKAKNILACLHELESKTTGHPV